MSQYCIECGVENSDEANFCKSCGQKLKIKEYEDFDNIEREKYEKKRITLNFIEFFFSNEGRISGKEFFLRGFLPLSSLLLLNGAFFKYINMQLLKSTIDLSLAQTLNYVGIAIYVIIIYSITVVSIKRVHDYNSSGWNVILNFIPIVNLIFLFFLFFKNTVNLNNEYGYESSSYKFNGSRIFFLVFNLVFFFMSWFVFAFSLQFEKMAIQESITQNINKTNYWNEKSRENNAAEVNNDYENLNVNTNMDSFVYHSSKVVVEYQLSDSFSSSIIFNYNEINKQKSIINNQNALHMQRCFLSKMKENNFSIRDEGVRLGNDKYFKNFTNQDIRVQIKIKDIKDLEITKKIIQNCLVN